jgi:Glycosyl transferase family group 2
VLDDSTDETSGIVATEVGAWAERGVAIAHLRRSHRVGWKAGALEAGRAVARGDLIAVFDADFVPEPDFLRRTVGAFSNPRVGLVQARWAHLNQHASLLTELQAMLLDGHFAVEQAGRAGSGACFNFNGTAGVWRAQAIADAGGWHADTLTEDLDLSYRAALREWRFVYAADVRAPAELPAGVPAFKSQQFRWAKGSVECARKLAGPVLRARWPWWRRLDALLHLTHNLPYLFTLVALVAGGLSAALGGGPRWAPAVHVVSLVTTLTVLGCFVVDGRGGWGRRLARVPALIALTAGMALSQTRAIALGAIGRITPFERTPKDGGVAARQRARAAPGRLAFVELALATYLVACTGVAAFAHGALLPATLLLVLASGVVAVGVGGLRFGRVR